MEQSMRTETKAPTHLSFSLLKHSLLLEKFSCTHTPRKCKHLHELIWVLILIHSTGNWVHPVKGRGTTGLQFLAKAQQYLNGRIPVLGSLQLLVLLTEHLQLLIWGERNSTEGSPPECDRTHSPNATASKFPWQTFSTKEREEGQTSPWMDQGYWGRLRHSLEQKHFCEDQYIAHCTVTVQQGAFFPWEQNIPLKKSDLNTPPKHISTNATDEIFSSCVKPENSSHNTGLQGEYPAQHLRMLHSYTYEAF